MAGSVGLGAVGVGDVVESIKGEQSRDQTRGCGQCRVVGVKGGWKATRVHCGPGSGRFSGESQSIFARVLSVIAMCTDMFPGIEGWAEGSVRRCKPSRPG